MNRIVLCMISCLFIGVSAMDNVSDNGDTSNDAEIENFKTRLDVPVCSERIKLSDDVLAKMKQMMLVKKQVSEKMPSKQEEIPAPQTTSAVIVKDPQKKQIKINSPTARKSKKKRKKAQIVQECIDANVSVQQKTVKNHLKKIELLKELNEALLKDVKYRLSIDQLIEGNSLNDVRYRANCRDLYKKLDDVEKIIKQKWRKYINISSNTTLEVPEKFLSQHLLELDKWLKKEEQILEQENSALLTSEA